MADVGISVKLDGLASVTSGLSTIKRDTQAVGTEAEKSGKKVDGMGNSLRTLRGALAGVGFGLAAREAIKLADAMTNMQSRIKLVVGSTTAAAATQQKLMDVANRTRSSFEAVGALYSRIGRSADALGISQERLVGFTETFSQALKISGASTGEASSTILQLSQALASGRLQGAELNAVLEAGGRAAQAIADGLGVPIGALKKLGEQGELTAERVIKAIESQSGVINSEFGEMGVTVSDSMTVMENALAEVIGKLNEGTGATKGLSAYIIELAEYMKQPETVSSIVAWGNAFADLGKILYGIIDVVSDVNRGLNMMLSDALYTIGAIDKATNEATRNRSLTSMAGEGAMNIVGSSPSNQAWKPSGKFGGQALGEGGGWAEIKTQVNKPAPAFDLSKALGGGDASKKTAAAKAAKQAEREFQNYLSDLRDEYDALLDIQQQSWDQAASLIEGAQTPLQQYNVELSNLNALFEGGFIASGDYNTVLDDMNRKLAESNETVRSIEDAFMSAFDAAISGTDDLGSALEDIGKSLASDLFKTNILNPAKDGLNGMLGSIMGGGGDKEEGSSPLDALGGSKGGEAVNIFDTFLSGLKGIFGEGDKGFLAGLTNLFTGEKGVLGALGEIFSGAWEILSTLFMSFLSEYGLLQAWEMAERWALSLWEIAERWAIAAVEAAASLLGFERGGELTVTRPTLFVAGEKNKAERIRVSPLSGGERGSTRSGNGGFASLSEGGGGGTTNVQVFIPPTSVINGMTEGAFARKITQAVRRQTGRTV